MCYRRKKRWTDFNPFKNLFDNCNLTHVLIQTSMQVLASILRSPLELWCVSCPHIKTVIFVGFVLIFKFCFIIQSDWPREKLWLEENKTFPRSLSSHLNSDSIATQCSTWEALVHIECGSVFPPFFLSCAAAKFWYIWKFFRLKR